MQKKRIASALLASALVAALAVPSMAAEITQDGGDTATQFTFAYKNDPTYTVTIPESVEIKKEGTDVSISAENVENLDGQKISVTIAGTSAYRNQMVLEGKSADGRNASMRYQFQLADGTIIETTGGKDQVNGVELASFTEDGTVSFKVLPVLAASSSLIQGVTYTGNMTYAVSLEDAE